jgi:hypothetical protein
VMHKIPCKMQGIAYFGGGLRVFWPTQHERRVLEIPPPLSHPAPKWREWRNAHA